MPLDEAFSRFAVQEDANGGVMVTAKLKDSQKTNHLPHGSKVYRSTSLAAINTILVEGLEAGPSSKAASNGEQIRIVFIHKHGTMAKARNYMKYFMSEGFYVSVLLRCV